MPDDRSAPPAALQLGRMAPGVFVTDLPRAVDFYQRVLGLRPTFENGTPVGFVILEKDAAELHLTRVDGHTASVENVAHLRVSDANALYAHCIATQVCIVKPLRDADFGLRCFVFADPDGNRIDVGETI